MNLPRISNKAKSTKFIERHLNCPKRWAHYKDVVAPLNPNTLFGIRCYMPGAHCKIGIEWEALGYYWNKLIIANKCDPSDLYVNISPGIDSVLLNGEYLGLSQSGLRNVLYFSTDKLAMRDGLKKSGRTITGLATIDICRRLMDQQSFSDLMWLDENYNDHVIEFTVFDQNIGTLPNRNTMFWEVRAY
jgi:hypothetical protein